MYSTPESVTSIRQVVQWYLWGFFYFINVFVKACLLVSRESDGCGSAPWRCVWNRETACCEWLCQEASQRLATLQGTQETIQCVLHKTCILHNPTDKRVFSPDKTCSYPTTVLVRFWSVTAWLLSLARLLKESTVITSTSVCVLLQSPATR